MRFSVPQFIDVEDKVFGPLTLKQAIYLTGGLGASYVSFRLLGFLGLLLLGFPLLGLAVMLAFIKINNRPFVLVASAAFFFKIKNKLYLWRKVPQKKTAAQNQVLPTETKQKIQAPDVTQSKLRALAFSLDTNEQYTSRDTS